MKAIKALFFLSIIISYSVTIGRGEIFNMRIKSNLILLIFCGVWSLGIAEFSDENIGK